MKNIIKTENYLLAVDESEIKDGNFMYLLRGNTPSTNEGEIAKCVFEGTKDSGVVWKKIIAHLPLNNSPILEGVDLLPPIEDEVKKLGEKCWCDNEITNIHSFVIGFKKAKEKYKYTEEDLRDAYNLGLDTSSKLSPNKTYDTLIQSLQQPKYPIGFECEMVTRVLDVYPQTINHIPKTTTNSQGQTVLEGKYIYE
jgi:hypothetical protein